MKHTINPKANGPLITPRLDVDIAGSLIKSVLKQPINNVDDMGVIRFGTIKLTQHQHLLEVIQSAGGQPLGRRAFDTLGDRIKFSGIAPNVRWVSDEPPNGFARLALLHKRLPARYLWFGTNDVNFSLRDFNCEDLMTLGELS